LSEADAGVIRRHYHEVAGAVRQAALECGRPPDSVRLVAVSKYRPAADAMVLYEEGQRAFGESRVQEARKKIPAMPADAEWHLIGQLQTNKAKYLPGLVQWVHSLDRIELAEALQAACARKGGTLNVLLQVNVAGEEQKGGCPPGEAEALARVVLGCPALRLAGLMQIAPFLEDPEDVRPCFHDLRTLRDHLQESLQVQLPELSMGMSHDFRVAIQEGATMVRIGTALYAGF
jgi:pyridoxal phosphate enzyme (YggS family)